MRRLRPRTGWFRAENQDYLGTRARAHDAVPGVGGEDFVSVSSMTWVCSLMITRCHVLGLAEEGQAEFGEEGLGSGPGP